MDPVTLAVSGCVALAGTVTFLYRQLCKRVEQHVDLSARIGRLEGEHEGIKNLSKKTLEVVHEALTSGDAGDVEVGEAPARGTV